MKKYWILAVAIMMLNMGNSCKKNEQEMALEDGIVLYSEMSASSDGCGWLIKVDTAYYFPVNLSETFREDQLQVQLAFKVMDEEHACPFGVVYPKITILEMKHR